MSTFRSRLTGHAYSRVPEFAWNGELQILQAFHVNGVSLTQGQYLLASGQGKLSTGTDTLDWSLSAPSKNGLLRFRATALNCLAQMDQPVSVWLNVSPMTPNLKEQADLLEVERVLEQTVGQLEDICHRPRTVLAAEEKVLPVAKVRRNSHRALSHLAAHPEHWLRPTAHNVHPSHLLASIRDENFAIYENRVVVTLLKRLSIHLQERIAALEKLSRQMTVLGDFSEVSRRGTYGRQKRLFSLWAEVSPDDPTKFAGRLNQIIERLQFLKRRVERCKNAPLYTELQRTPVQQGLRMTNIFRNESRYRKVAQLWHAWDTVPRLGQSSMQQAEDLQMIARGFAAYSAVLVGRALQQLSFKAEENQPWGRGRTIVWSTAAGDLHLNWNEDDVLELFEREKLLLRLVPLLAHSSPPSAQPISVPTLLVFLDEEGSSITEPAWDIKPLQWGSVGVNSDDLTSIERLGRALTPIVRGHFLAHYPVELPRLVDPPPPNMDVEKHHWLLREPAQVLALQGYLEQLEQKLLQPTSYPVKKGQRQEQEKLQHDMTQAHLAVHRFGMLTSCPLCHEQDVRFESRTDGTYAAICRGCHAQWGTRRCVSCSITYPYLLPRLEEWPAVTDLSPNWADQYFGLDLLALPTVASAGRQFECPACSRKASA